MPKNGQPSKLRTDTIYVNSDTWNRLEQFANNHSSDWKATPASYNSDFYIRQGNFSLMGWNNGTSVVVNFTDANGQANQLARSVKPGELDFLTE